MSNPSARYAILQAVQEGRMTVDQAVEALVEPPSETTEDLGFARIDHARQVRQGLAEVVYAEGKLPQETATIVQHLWERPSPLVIATRVNQETADAIVERVPAADYHARARLIIAQRPDPSMTPVGRIAVVAAGTSDLTVAEEAYWVSQALGNTTDLIVDVGVAGIHRLFEAWDRISLARVIIVVAGMEGALASVVGGLANCPVLAVPSPVGYGAALEGLTARMAMLSRCAPGVGVLNIGNGIGAAVLASRINHLARD
jgi:NCAIR mutase (PurE)-related protein